MLSDEELIKSAVNGNMDAFEALIKKYEKLIYVICYRMFNNVEDAKDVSQEVFLKIYKNMGKAIGKGSFKSWVGTVTNNACIDVLRTKKKIISLDSPIAGDEDFKLDIPDTEPLPDEKLINKENKEIILSSIEKLPSDYKSIIVLREMNNLSYEEISEILKINIGTVKSRISRSRKKLSEIYLNELEHYKTNSVK